MPSNQVLHTFIFGNSGSPYNESRTPGSVSTAPVGSAVIRLPTPLNIRPPLVMVANINGLIPKSKTHRATT